MLTAEGGGDEREDRLELHDEIDLVGVEERLGVTRAGPGAAVGRDLPAHGIVRLRAVAEVVQVHELLLAQRVLEHHLMAQNCLSRISPEIKLWWGCVCTHVALLFKEGHRAGEVVAREVRRLRLRARAEALAARAGTHRRQL